MKWLFNKSLSWIVQAGFRKLPPDIQDEVRKAINDTYPDGEIRKAVAVLNKRGTPIVPHDA